MKQLEGFIDELQATWSVLFPRVPVPDSRQWALWVTLHGQDIVRQSVAKLALRYERSSDLRTADSVYRFASALMSKLSRAGVTTTTIGEQINASR
jgi:hypothetical protein